MCNDQWQRIRQPRGHRCRLRLVLPGCGDGTCGEEQHQCEAQEHAHRHFLPTESVKLRPKIERPTVASPTVPVPSTDARELPSVRPTSFVTFSTIARNSTPPSVATDMPRSN